MRRTIAIYARHWIARPFYRLLGIRRPSDGLRELEYRALRHGR
ncbi:hypothetical protein [Streptomyces cyslabdanicus]